MTEVSPAVASDAGSDVILYDSNHCIIRQLKARDESALRDMFAQCAAADVYLRCFAAIKDFSKTTAARICGYGQRSEIALVATLPTTEGTDTILGVAHVILVSEATRLVEFDVMVRTDLKGQGIGYALMSALLEEARHKGFAGVTGYILRENPAMLQMVHELGFTVDRFVGGVAEVSVAFADHT